MPHNTPHAPESPRPSFRDRLAADYGMPPDLARAAREMSPAPGWVPLVEISLQAVWHAPATLNLGFGTKDKYGALVFEHRGVTREIADLMDDLEQMSGSMCEVCGAPARPVDLHGWVHTLCQPHRTAAESAGFAGQCAVFEQGWAALPAASAERFENVVARLIRKRRHRKLLLHLARVAERVRSSLRNDP